MVISKVKPGVLISYILGWVLLGGSGIFFSLIAVGTEEPVWLVIGISFLVFAVWSATIYYRRTRSVVVADHNIVVDVSRAYLWNDLKEIRTIVNTRSKRWEQVFAVLNLMTLILTIVALFTGDGADVTYTSAPDEDRSITELRFADGTTYRLYERYYANYSELLTAFYLGIEANKAKTTAEQENATLAYQQTTQL